MPQNLPIPAAGTDRGESQSAKLVIVVNRKGGLLLEMPKLNPFIFAAGPV